jgi:hypothetical protein
VAFTQGTAEAIEREARHRVPRLLTDLLEEPVVPVEPAGHHDAPQADLLASDGHGRLWVIEVKSSSRPGHVERAAEQLLAYADGGVIPVLVVPFMSRAGAETADRARLNWMDLSGNAHIRAENLHLWVLGRPDELRSRGRPSSPFAPKSARVTRALLLNPYRWWLQKDLAAVTGLDDGNVSRIVRRLDEEFLLERRDRQLRPRDPDLLLDAWAQDYRFSGHDILPGHLSGSGIDLARALAERLESLSIHHAFTGLPAAWAMDQFARFRLTTVYVDGDPREVAERLGIRRITKGANIQLVGPNDAGVFNGERDHGGLHCVAPVQVYLDLLQLPERATEAAQHLRAQHLQWKHGTAS